MARPLAPTTLLRTAESFIPVSSSSFSNRWASQPAALTSSVRRRVRSRNSRMSRCGTKDAITIPEAPARARKAASFGSVLRPRIPFRWAGLTSIRFRCGWSR
ncbi:hypothetical protein QFZ82_000091 [Streptomyces sp. V4I23]|nr:hypothetical protein [Streptomyces sp. V4I23]